MRILGSLLCVMIIIAAVGAYYHFIYLPERQEEERIKPLMEYAGFTREEAIRFDERFKEYAPYNQTLLDFAYFLKKYPLMTSGVFRLTGSFSITVSSLKNAEPIISEVVTGDQRGRDFILKYPFIISDDGINTTDAKLMFYDFIARALTSYVIENLKDQLSRIITLDLLYPNIQNKTLTEGQALDFIKKYPRLLPLNYSSLVLAKHWTRVPDLVDFLINRYPVNIAKDSILLLYPNIQNKTLSEDISINFISAYPDLVKNGIDLDNLPYLKFYHRHPILTDSLIKNIPYELGVSVIFNLNSFLANNTFTENKAAYFISLYPALARSFGSHREFPRLIYLFTQIPKSADVGIKTIEDFEFLVNTLNSVLRYADKMKKKEEKIAFFMERYPWLIKEYNWDEENTIIFEFHEQHPTLTDTLLNLKIRRDHVISTIHNVRPYLKEIPESTINDFMKSYGHLVRDDGLNQTDVRLLPYYHEHRLLTDTAIKELKDLDSILFVLESYYPYIKEREISSLRLRRYILEDGDLFRVKGYVHPLADPDEDYMNNITEMKILRDLFFGIGNFTWTPTKVINNKVYEVNVYVRSKSVRGILLGRLYWIPINYTQFPLEVQLRAFPNETIREFGLIPLDENSIEITIPIEGFKGGREYKIVALIKDRAGNVERREMLTPYIREFENLGKLLYEKGAIISISYYHWYDYWPWPTVTTPLLGKYRSNDNIVMKRHIDWASGAGYNTFFLAFSSDSKKNIEEFLSEPLMEDINIAILYESLSQLYKKGTWPVTFEGEFYEKNLEILKADFDYFVEKLFNKRNYWKINGRPVVYFFDSSGFIGDVDKALEELRSYTITKYGFNPYLISDHMNPGVKDATPENPVWVANAQLYDGITAWGGGFYGSEIFLGDSYEEQLKLLYDMWLPWAIKNQKGFFMSFKPGEDSRQVPWGGKMILPRSPDLYIKRWKIVLDYLVPELGVKGVRIDTWNDFFEHTEIEPSVEDKGLYLRLSREILATYLKSATNL